MDDESRRAFRTFSSQSPPSSAEMLRACSILRRNGEKFIDLAAEIQESGIYRDHVDDIEYSYLRGMGWKRRTRHNYGDECERCGASGTGFGTPVSWLFSPTRGNRRRIMCAPCLFAAYPRKKLSLQNQNKLKTTFDFLEEIFNWTLEYEDPAECWVNCRSPEAMIIVLSQNDGESSARVNLALIKCVETLVIPLIKESTISTKLKVKFKQLFEYWSKKSNDLPDNEGIYYRPFKKEARIISSIISSLFPVESIPPGSICLDCQQPNHICPFYSNCSCCLEQARREEAEDLLGNPSRYVAGIVLDIEEIIRQRQIKKVVGESTEETRKMRRKLRKIGGNKEVNETMCDIIRSVVPCPTVNKNIYFV